MALGEIASSPAVQQPLSVPDAALPQQDSAGYIVGWYLVNDDGTTTVWDAYGQNPTTTTVAPPPESWWAWATAPRFPTPIDTVRDIVGAAGEAAGDVAGAAGAGAAKVVEKTLLEVLKSVSPTTWLLVGGVALVIFMGPELLMAGTVSRRRR